MNSKRRIVAFGDSITEGVIGIKPEENWLKLLSSRLGDGYECFNAGVGGNSAREAMARFDKDVLAKNPDIVIIEFGGNNRDPWCEERRVDDVEFKRHLADFKSRLSAKCDVIVVTFPPIVDEWHACSKAPEAAKLFPCGLNISLEPQREIVREFAKFNDWPLVDLYAILKDDARRYVLKDGVHLNPEGQMIFADAVFDAIRKLDGIEDPVSVFNQRTDLADSEYWAGIKRHPAVVNPVGREPSADVMSLSGEWEFKTFSHGSGKRTVLFQENEEWSDTTKIHVPGSWAAQGVGGEGMGIPYLCQDNSPKRIRGAFVGEGWYRRSFTIPKSWSGRRIWLKVGGVGSQGWFYVNGHAVALHDRPCGAWKYEITPFVEPGAPAKIVAVIDNAVARRGGYACSLSRWGGILRDLELESTPLTFIDDAWVRGDFDLHRAEVHIDIQGEKCFDGLEIRAAVEGESVSKPVAVLGEQVVRVSLKNFRPWSPEKPELYWAEVVLLKNGVVIQKRRERFGVRKFEVRCKQFFLNDKPFYLRGFGDNFAYPISGATPPDREFHLKHLLQAHNAGFNFVRHHTHSECPEYFEAADEAGIIIQPELPYYLDNPNDYFDYNPLRDAWDLHVAFRRYVSFAVRSSGNEGLLGPAAGKYMYDFLKWIDPDRLVVEEDGASHYSPGHSLGRSDYAYGPLSPWNRGTFNPRCFIAHEFLNIAVKFDCRDADKYVGAWCPPVTREDRRGHLAESGLFDVWMDRLQDGQYALQSYWQKNGIEWVRCDPHCAGYCFWTICDTTVFNDKAGIFTSQGMFDPMWQTKRHGTSPEMAAVWNSPSCVLIDTSDHEWNDPVDNSETNIYSPWYYGETKRVYESGDEIPVKFLFHNFSGVTFENTILKWSFTSEDGKVLSSGSFNAETIPHGNLISLGKRRIVVPEVVIPVKARFIVSVADISNSWDFWFFPKFAETEIPDDIVFTDLGSPEAKKAITDGKHLVTLANQTGKSNYALGWWNIGTQVGTAAVRHPIWGNFPFEEYLTPLLFEIIKEGTKLPVAGFTENDYVMVGEGCKEADLYLAVKDLPNGRKHVFVSGLDITSDTVAGRALKTAIVCYLSNL